MNDINFTVVIVTYNRLECLKKTLECYSKQTLSPKALIVVNNASTDGTAAFLDTWKSHEEKFQKIVVTNNKNTGGAGGFSTGVDTASKLTGDFIFLADDDAYADANALMELNNFYKNSNNQKDIVAICTSVVNYGNYDLVHRRRVKRGPLYLKRIPVKDKEYYQKYFEIDEFSFVGVAIRNDIVRKIGNPRADYFIYFDDTEYSHRVSQMGKIFCVPSSKMNHNVAAGHGDNDVTWRSYYSLRNSLDILLKYYPKRYFYFEAGRHYFRRCTILTRVIKKRTKAQSQLLIDAIKDAKKGDIKLSEKYYPGSKL